jgi:hypothetical protein
MGGSQKLARFRESFLGLICLSLFTSRPKGFARKKLFHPTTYAHIALTEVGQGPTNSSEWRSNMRFLNGMLGTWAGLCIAQLVFGVLGNGLEGFIGSAVINVVFAAIGTGIVMAVEKSDWGFGKTVFAGTIVNGLIAFAATAAIMVLMFGPAAATIPAALWGIMLVASLVTGAFAGVGYRMVAGVKPE